MNHLFRACLFPVLLLGQLPALPNAPVSIRSVDFFNYTYPQPLDYDPPKMELVTLKNGNYYYPDDERKKTGIFLKNVLYGDVTGDGTEDAVVVLNDEAGGPTYWQATYVFQMNNGHPALIFKAVYERGQAVKLRHHELIISAPEWMDDDPRCCPKYMDTYTLKYCGPQQPVFKVANKSRKQLHQAHLDP